MVTSLDSPPYRSHRPISPARQSASVTATAWSPGAGLAVADWIRQGRCLGALGRGSGWWIGDWIRYGNARYGEKYSLAVRATGYDVQSLRNMAYVAGRFDVHRRRDRLSFSHHAELAGLPLQDQDLWLDRAEAGALSVGSLRSELRQARHREASRAALTGGPTQAPPGGAGGAIEGRSHWPRGRFAHVPRERDEPRMWRDSLPTNRGRAGVSGMRPPLRPAVDSAAPNLARRRRPCSGLTP